MTDKEKYLLHSIETKMKLIASMAQHFGLLELLENEVNTTLKVMEETAEKLMQMDNTTNAIREAFGIDDKTTFVQCDGQMIIDDLGKDDE